MANFLHKIVAKLSQLSYALAATETAFATTFWQGLNRAEQTVRNSGVANSSSVVRPNQRRDSRLESAGEACDDGPEATARRLFAG
jgi:hypothetical protein